MPTKPMANWALSSTCLDYPAACDASLAVQRKLALSEQVRMPLLLADKAAQAEICSVCRLIYIRETGERLGWMKAMFRPW